MDKKPRTISAESDRRSEEDRPGRGGEKNAHCQTLSVRLGEFQELKVARETRHGIYLVDDEGLEVLLPRGQCPPREEIEPKLRVFVYTDSEDRPVATRKEPAAAVGEFAVMRAISVTSSGAFLDWGLDKDLFCPVREQWSPMREGRSYLVRVYLDPVSRRVACSSKLSKFLQRDGHALKTGQAVKLLIAELLPDMRKVVIDDRFQGSLFRDEWTGEMKVGEIRRGYVKSVRPDGKVAVSLRPQGFEAVLGERERVLAALREAGGTLAVSDKSPPERIQAMFGLSKGAFKKLLGVLYKEGKVQIEAERIRLTEG